MKYSIISICAVCGLLFLGCSDSDVSPPYSKDWVLNLSEYLGTDYSLIDSYLLSDYGLTTIDAETVLLHEFSKKGRNFVEIDVDNGAFLDHSPFSFLIWNTRKRMDGSVLIAGYGAADSYLLGTYDKDASGIDPLATLESSKINDPANLKGIAPGDDVLYSHNPNVNPADDNVYIAKWDFQGNQIWRESIDPSKKNKVGKILSVQKDHLLYVTIADSDLPTENWKVGKLSKDGEVMWHKQLNEYGYIFDIQENSAGDFFVLNVRGVSKHDKDGNLLWKDDLNEYSNHRIWGGAAATSDGGILLELANNKDEESLLKLNSNGEVVWEEHYWEDVPGKLQALYCLELPSKHVIVYSSTGYITRYKSSGN